jgi:PAS domain S-box-containing protein
MEDLNKTKEELLAELRFLRAAVARYEGNGEQEDVKREPVREEQKRPVTVTRRESEIRGLYEASRAVLDFHNFEETAKRIFEACKNIIGAISGYVALMGEGGMEQEVVFLDSGGMPCDVDPELPMPIRGLRARVCSSAAAVYENDFMNSRWARLAPPGHLNLQNVMFAPLILNGKVAGLLGLANKPGDFTEDDARIATGFGHIAAIALDKTRSEEELRRSRTLLSKSQKMARIGSWSFDLRANRLTWSDEVYSIFGLERQEFDATCEAFLAAVHPEDREAVSFAYTESLREGQNSREIEYRIVRRDNAEIRYIHEKCMHQRDAAGRVVRSVGMAQDITERKRAETEILRLYARDDLILNSTVEGIVVLDMAGKITFANSPAAQMLGYTPEELIGEDLHELAHYAGPDGAPYPLSACPMQESLQSGAVNRVRNEVLWRKNGTGFPADYSSTPIVEEGRRTGAVVTFRDVTQRKLREDERKKLEEQLNQAQKMESVGRLAGGVAHDFNNMLAVIIGRAEMAMLRDIGPDAHDDLMEILKAGKRSADLTRQLLAFASKQTAMPKLLDLNDTISGMFKMLRRLIREDIDLSWAPALDLWNVKIDPSQVDQILASLLVNAADAVSSSGAVTIRTENVVVDGSDVAEHAELIPGEYVLLSVSDTGAGMSKDVLEKIFEPFFTTKELGKGTGLGLSTVYGIVKQNDGFIYAESKPGKGAMFKIYLPRVEDEAAKTSSGEMAGAGRRKGTETILLVEDDEAILNLSRMILESLGYAVLAAHTPLHAIQLAEEHPEDIRLLITDEAMPGMNGRELVERLRVIIPSLKYLFMYGSAADVTAHRGVVDQEVNFIQKPFRTDNLAVKVRQALDDLEKTAERPNR